VTGAPAAPRYGWFGDDFTGATDTLAALAAAGQRAMLFPRLPTPAQLAAAGPLDAVGLAGATRAMAPAAMREVLEPAGRFLAGLGVRVLHYKCCSTFDSAPHIGSIGAAVAALQAYVPSGPVPVVGGQPGIGRYCLFSHLFAAAGEGGAVYRLDRHPTMSVHPVTPMAESDLRRHLAAQGLADIAAVHYPAYEGGADALAAALRAPAPALLDVSRAADLAVIGAALARRAAMAPLLAVGPSSVAQALAEAWPRGDAAPAAPLAPAAGPVFVLVGSLSPVSRAQADAARSYDQIEATAQALTGDAAGVLADCVRRLRAGRPVLLRTAPPTGAVTGAEAGALARAGAGFVRRLLAEVPLRRVGIAGGDTSSHVALGLDIWGLAWRGALAPGVTLCAARADRPALDGIEMMLKGGQMGPVDLFERFLNGAGRVSFG
jgi:uncharacterized protein YgbK (DUF1537 family)